MASGLHGNSGRLVTSRAEEGNRFVCGSATTPCMEAALASVFPWKPAYADKIHALVGTIDWKFSFNLDFFFFF